MTYEEVQVHFFDMRAKSTGEEDHPTDLQKIFERLRKYSLKLNPNKCTFAVTSGKLLRFIFR